MKPERFGPYLLVDRLGVASLSEVFLALRIGDADGTVHVLKRPGLDARSSDQVSEAIRREAEVLASVSHSVLPRLVDHGTLAGLPFVVLEYVAGHSIARLLDRGPQPEGVIKVVGATLLRGLRALHDAGWVHGDVSPGNIIVDDLGEIRLIDLGLAVRIDAPRSHPAGTPGYASPRAALGRPLVPYDDLYSAAIVLTELQLGERLYPEDALADALRRPLFADNPRMKRVSSPLVSILSGYSEPTSDLTATLVAFESATTPADRTLFAEFARGRPTPVDRATMTPDTASSSSAGKTLESEPLPMDGPVMGRSVVVETPPLPTVAPRASNRVVILLLLATIAALVIGVFIGRKWPGSRARDRDGSITLPMLPARTEVKIDGELMLVPEAGRAIPVKPGKHTITVDSARGDPREYNIVVEPGDKVLVITLGKGR